MGIQTNHFIAVMTALQITKLAKDKGFSKIWLEDDSMNIVKYLNGSSSLSWTIHNIIMKTFYILKSMEKYHITLVYCKSNMVVDSIANEVVRCYQRMI